MILTRKIEIYVNEPDKEIKSEHFNTLHKWRFTCLKAANILSSHYFTMDNIKNMVYLDDSVKVKLADKNKDPEGILSTSYRNTGYQLVSSLFKGTMPMDILSNLKDVIFKTYKEEKTEYYKGDRSLRSYRNNIPIPFSSKALKFTKQENSKNYNFSLFKIPFATRMGADRSGNEIIIDRILSNEYKLCNSSITWDKRKNKWFLLLCYNQLEEKFNPTAGKIIEADLNVLIPIIAKADGKKIEIGHSDEFNYPRIQIQHKLHTLQKSLRYANGGKGRKSKLQAIERFKKKEKNYVTTKLHTYSRMLVRFAIKEKAEKIILKNQNLKESSVKENDFVLRNWGYYGLKQMIEYKSHRVGINVE